MTVQFELAKGATRSTAGTARQSRATVAAVVIGRNEGERLVRCLESLGRELGEIVYVDSGSTDGSGGRAAALGAEVVELAMDRPFTAARARNAGFRRCVERWPGVELVQFMDGDCECAPRWIERASDWLRGEPKAALVFGRLRERHPDRSVYNRLCDMEWAGVPGPASSCGGNVLARAAALRSVGGFREDLIAGEEPELCVRLARDGWGVARIDEEMGTHDAAMNRFGQWWRRMVRAGHAYAEGARLHGAIRGGHCVRNVGRALAWGIAAPAALVVGAAGTAWNPWAGATVVVAVMLSVVAVTLRTAWWRRSLGDPVRHAALYAAFCVLGKAPEALGVIRYWGLSLVRRRSGLIEHK